MTTNVLGNDEVPAEDFQWLDDLVYDDCFTLIHNDSNFPSKSLDYGRDGYTGSLTHWHELLQITAPDPNYGLVYVRGDYPDDPNSIYARTHRYNAPGTWGLKPDLQDQDNLQLSEPNIIGFINLRWPYTQFSLVCKGHEDGTYTTCSFVKDGVLFQIIRIVLGKTIARNQNALISALQQSKPQKLRFKVGGRVRMGCPFQSKSFNDSEAPAVDYSEETKTLSCRSRFYSKTLALRMWVDRKQVELRQEKPVAKEKIVNMAAINEVELVADTPKIIVTSFSLFSSSNETHNKIITKKLPQLILSSTAQDYMGVADSSKNAPYRLWKAILAQEEDNDTGNSDRISDTNTIGRSIEQILCVSSIPMINPIAEEDSATDLAVSGEDGQSHEVSLPSTNVNGPPHSATEASKIGLKSSLGNGTIESSCKDTHHTTHKGIALIKNIISCQLVDVESTFWQIRLLIKACQLITRKTLKLPEKGKYDQPLREMGVLYKEALLRHIELACRWLINAAPVVLHEKVPASIVFNTPELIWEYWFYSGSEKSVIAEFDRSYYRTIILWYTLHHCPDALKYTWTKERVCSEIGTLETIGYNEPQPDDPKTTLLQYYHYSCFLQICYHLESESGASVLNNRFVNEEVAAQSRRRATQSLKTSGKDPSNRGLDDYRVVNLALLAKELFSNLTHKFDQHKDNIAFVKENIKKRDWTSILNPGDDNQKHATWSPWELTFLNHHSLIRPEVDADEEKVNAALKACREFLFPDYTCASSWDDSNVCMVSMWWDLLPTSIFAATLLDRELKLQDSNDPSPTQEGKLNNVETTDVKELTSNQRYLLPGILENKPAIKIGDDLRDEFFKRILEGLAQVATRQGEKEVFNWRRRKPPRMCFPDAFVQSLEDTPELFLSQQLEKVEIRSNIKKYFKEKKHNPIMPDLGYTLNNVTEKIKAEELLYLSCWDLSRTYLNTTIIISRKGRVDPDLKGKKKDYLDDIGSPEPCYLLEDEISDRSEQGGGIRTTSSLWSLYLDGFVHKHPKFDQLPTPVKNKLEDTRMRKELLSEYQQSLFLRLHDSFVDLGTRFRIFFVQRYSPAIIDAFIYIWHANALDAFDAHLGTVSKFFNDNVSIGSADVWITRITILHWSLEYNNKDVPKIFGEVRGEKAEFPPLNLSGVNQSLLDNLFRSWTGEKESPSNQEIGETASTLVITGDDKGFSWNCSVVSSIMDENLIDQCATTATKILQMFKHQQRSGRSLVFFMFLGHICVELAHQNEDFIKILGKAMDMEQRTMLKGIEWHKSQLALRRLKTMLWAMEALRIFGDKLNLALTEIEEARSKLKHELDKEDPLRHKALKRAKDNILEEFDKRYNRLKDSQTTILHVMEQSSRLREGITSVLGIEQNENIAMLTYITIAYLPLGFIAALFSTHVVPDSTGVKTFGLLLASFLVGTFIFALSLQYILATMRRSWKAVNRQISDWKWPFGSLEPETLSSEASILNARTHSESTQTYDLESGTQPRA